MNQTIDLKEITDQIELPGGEIIVLLDRLGKSSRYSKEEQARNVFRLNAERKIVWQVCSSFDSDGGPFTHLHAKHEIYTAYRWDGGTYVLDIGTGFATPHILER